MINELCDIDSVIFDCDGVLIDIKNSYDKTIKETVKYIIKRFVNVEINKFVTNKLINDFKQSGGFNNEVDLAYSIILSIITAIKLNKPYEKFIFEVIRHIDIRGMYSVDDYLSTLLYIKNIKHDLNYPNNDNVICNVFDELFYGSKLYYSIFKKNTIFHCIGFINNDEIILTKKLLETLKQKFRHKIAIVTGRGMMATRYSLKSLLDYFNIKNSMFLDDMARSFAKPNPLSLITSIKGLHSSHCLYVGDSVEDLLMANKATELGFKVTFCGVYGTDENKKDKIDLFKKKNAHMILKSINSLPNALNLV
ncbi:MAG: HAD family hydrolase [Thaumarchaeota archaeon]|nr:HAD family hydrolase [Nitrososphaerota archaeon]MCY3976110.1 HAD family hydrolase [Nitrososphaerota archaeon]